MRERHSVRINLAPERIIKIAEENERDLLLNWVRHG
jgi:hypothetical protein